jgi:hypothetical protein
MSGLKSSLRMSKPTPTPRDTTWIVADRSGEAVDYS